MVFDEIICRKNTDSLKYDFAAKQGKPEDILPLWVADMDFRAPDCVLEALAEKSRHGIFGYSESSYDYYDVLRDWFLERFDWEIRQSWLIKTPGVVFAVCAAIRALTKKGESVLIQQPVYYPFAESIVQNERKLVVNQLVYSQNQYHIDFEDFEKKVIDNSVKLFILCSPHNPVGRVWTIGELTKIGDICLKHHVIVVSDEIHADFIYPGYKHTVFANIKPEFAGISVICTAPTKTFNLAGLQISNIFISDEKIRHALRSEIDKAGYCQANIMGLVACKAAYQNGRGWLEELKAYLNDNLCFLRNFLKERLSAVKLVEPEGTYLIWLDFKALRLDDNALEDLIVTKANLWLDGGLMFGSGGEGFQRINIACPRNLLEQALTQLEKAINS
jgi:cysteine-S-conjugate beta-lyase